MDRISGLNSFSINSSSVYQQHNQNPVGASEFLSSVNSLSYDKSSMESKGTDEMSNDFKKVQQAGQLYAEKSQLSTNPRLRAYQQVSKMGKSEDMFGINLSV